MTGGSFDPGTIGRAGSLLRDGVDDVDRAIEELPDDIDAGAYSPWVVEICTGVIARTGEVVLNVDQYAQELIFAAEGYRACEQRNADVVNQFLNYLDATGPPPDPFPPQCPICGHSSDHHHDGFVRRY